MIRSKDDREISSNFYKFMSISIKINKILVVTFVEKYSISKFIIYL